MRRNSDLRRQASAWQCVLAASAAVLCVGSANGATVDWSATAASSSWATSGNWVGDVTPASDLLTDIARFNQPSYLSQPDAGTRTVGGIVIGDGTTATAALTLSGTQLTLGIAGINMLATAGPATFSTPVTLGTGQTWTNASGSTLAFDGAITRTAGKTLSFVNSGAGSITSSTLANDATGIIGPWATFGTGASTRYATMSGSTLAGYTGGTAITSANVNTNMTSATTNYDYNSGNATVTSSLSANTLRYTNASTSSVGMTLGAGNPTITLNGVLNAGGGQFGFSYATGTTGSITIGSSNELVLNAANKNIAINVPITDGGAAGSLTITGPNAVNFGAGPGNAAVTHTFTGSITINPGSTFSMGFQASAPNASSVTLNNGTLGLGSNSIVAALGSGPMTINGGTLTKSGGSGVTYALGSQRWNADFAVTGTAKIGLGGAVTLGKSITIDVSSTGGFLATGAIGDGGNGHGITKTGSGLATLGGSGSTFSGPVTVSAGELDMAAGTVGSPLFTAANTVNVNTGAILGVASSLSGTTDTIGGIGDGAGGGGTVRNATTGVRTLILSGSGNYSFSGVISNATGGAALNINKTGAGTQTLSGANTYTGATTIGNGLLKVNGSLAATAVAVNAGGRLGGTGSIGGRVTVAGGSASRGALDLRDGATGTLSLAGNLTTTGTAGNYTEMFFDLSGATSDTIAITGTPTIGAGDIKINLNALGDLQGGEYTLMTADGGLGTGNITLASDTLVYGGKTYTFTLAASSGTAEILTVVIPEPSILGGLMIGALGMLARRRHSC